MLNLLAKLTAKTCSLTPIGGKSETTWEDVILAMPRASRHAQLFIFAKYCGIGSDKELLKLAKREAIKRFQGEKMDELQIETLAALALGESLSPGHCKKCNGSGQLPIKNGFITCSACEGTGRGKDISDRQLANALGVSAKRVKYFWRAKLNELLAEYQSYEMEADESLKKGLTRD